MESVPDAPLKQQQQQQQQRHIRVSRTSLSTSEAEYIERRKEVVLESLERLHVNCTVLGQDGLLDTLLYLGGVSGSTWTMALIYSDPQWSANMEPVLSRLLGSRPGFPEILAWLQDKAKEDSFSLSFQGGELKKQTPEMDMVQLQGILTSALAHDETLEHLRPPWLNMTAADNLRQMMTAKSLSAEEQKNMINQANQELVASVQTWCQEMDDFNTYALAATWMAQDLLPLVMKWEWGTTRNFLYQYEDSEVPPCLHSREVFHLMDAGFSINVPYPSFLGEKRDIDLLIAPEYSAGDMFETLTLARDYAAKVKKPFPVIDDKILEDKDWPEDLYVFPGVDDQPTIVFMPLFNRKNCKDKEEVQAKMTEYATFHLPFTKEKSAALLEIARVNMRNNKDAIGLSSAQHRSVPPDHDILGGLWGPVPSSVRDV
ncbi:hypothetical protein CRUP_005732 [Coryphaenoides rupestris]|nr:hypothetical protein CRUP_005732 [Coryphaenoides rupestris]